jgi:hypothetical protein
MELRGQYAGYTAAFVLATSAWRHHGLGRDPCSRTAWRALRKLVYEDVHLRYVGVPQGGVEVREGRGKQGAGVQRWDGEEESMRGCSLQGEMLGSNGVPLIHTDPRGHAGNGNCDLEWLLKLVGPSGVCSLPEAGSEQQHPLKEGSRRGTSLMDHVRVCSIEDLW